MNIVFLSKKHFLKTHSDRFLINLLSTFAKVSVLRVEDYSNSELIRLVRQKKPDWVVFFATQPSFFHHILRLPFVKKVFVPMYDGFKAFSKRKEKLFRLFGLKAICFSEPVDHYLKGIGLKTIKVRYFPPFKLSKRTLKKEPPYTFFLWQRSSEINVERLKNLVGEESIEKIIYKTETANSNDPKIEKIDRWLSKDELDHLVEQADFFIAPRLQEGIGMSFLDALVLGVPVIAWNDHTMNEYIVPGKNGFFFQKEKLELSSPQALSSTLSKLNQSFHVSWQEDKKRIISFFFS